jgi:hypothetical protein
LQPFEAAKGGNFLKSFPFLPISAIHRQDPPLKYPGSYT